MKRKLLFLIAFLPALGFGQVFTENWDGGGQGLSAWTVIDVDGLPAAAGNPYDAAANPGWAVVDRGGPTPNLGGPDGNFAAVSTSWYTPAGTSNDWLISPAISNWTAGSSAFLTWESKAQDPLFPDGYELRLAPNGGNTPEDFTVVLYSTTGDATVWTAHSVDLSTYAGTTIRFAFVNNSNDKYVLLVDNISILDEEPEPVFPAPYCAITGFGTVEPITLVDFAGINNSTSAEVGGTPNLEDFTSMVGLVDPLGTYPITLKGNADGDFSNYYTVYFDWNHNDLLTDEGEAYQIGFSTGSTGEDDIEVTGDIVVPATALEGDTRMRVVKRFNAYTTSPCAPSSAYGQAEDYTVSVTALATNSFNASQFAYYPNPVKNTLNLSYNKNITDVKVLNLLGQEVIVRSINATQGQIDMSNLSTGTYIVKVTADNAVQTIKVVKQ